jgi:hypothetical protein
VRASLLDGAAGTRRAALVSVGRLVVVLLAVAGSMWMLGCDDLEYIDAGGAVIWSGED